MPDPVKPNPPARCPCCPCEGETTDNFKLDADVGNDGCAFCDGLDSYELASFKGDKCKYSAGTTLCGPPGIATYLLFEGYHSGPLNVRLLFAQGTTMPALAEYSKQYTNPTLCRTTHILDKVGGSDTTLCDWPSTVTVSPKGA